MEMHRERELLSAEDPHAGDGRVVVRAEEDHRSEGVLLQLLETLKHP